MENEFVLVILIGGLAAALTAIGPLIAERFDVPPRVLGRALQFAAGVLTALVAFTLMPPTVRVGSAVAAVVGFFVGGALFVIMDFISARRQAQRATEIATVSAVLYIGIIVDMLIDGVVIGLGSTLTLGKGVVLALSVALSTAPLALATTALAKQSGASTRFRSVLLFLYIAALVGGALFGYLIVRNQSIELRLFLIALASGFLITTVTQSIIPEANRDGEPSLSALFFVGGLSLYALFTLGAS